MIKSYLQNKVESDPSHKCLRTILAPRATALRFKNVMNKLKSVQKVEAVKMPLLAIYEAAVGLISIYS